MILIDYIDVGNRFFIYRVAVVIQFEFGSLDKPSSVRQQAFLVLQHAR